MSNAPSEKAPSVAAKDMLSPRLQSSGMQVLGQKKDSNPLFSIISVFRRVDAACSLQMAEVRLEIR